MHELRITQIGNSLGFILPKDYLARHQLNKGDALYLSDTPTGLALNKYNPAFELQMAAARKIMAKRRNVLRELAK